MENYQSLQEYDQYTFAPASVQITQKLINSSVFVHILNFLRSLQQQQLQQLNKQFYDKIIPKSKIIVKQRKHRKVKHFYQQNTVGFQDAPKNELKQNELFQVSFKDGQLIDASKHGIGPTDFNTGFEICELRGKTYIFRYSDLPTESQIKNDDFTKSQIFRINLHIKEQEDRNQYLKKDITLDDLCEIKSYDNFYLRKFSILPINFLNGILLVGGYCHDRTQHEGCLFYDIEQSTQKDSNIDLKIAKKYQFNETAVFRENCTLVKFGDTKESTKVFIYALNGSKTNKLSIERIVIHIMNGVKKFQNGTSKQSMIDDGDQSYKGQWEKVEIQYSESIMNLKDMIFMTQFKYGESAFDLSNYMNPQHLDKKHENIMIIFCGTRKMMKITKAYMLKFNHSVNQATIDSYPPKQLHILDTSQIFKEVDRLYSRQAGYDFSCNQLQNYIKTLNNQESRSLCLSELIQSQEIQNIKYFINKKQMDEVGKVLQNQYYFSCSRSTHREQSQKNLIEYEYKLYFIANQRVLCFDFKRNKISVKLKLKNLTDQF